jgi:cytokinesis protein
LRQVVPTADELEKVRSYSGDVSLLSEADQFHLEMNELCDDLAARLEAWEFVNHFDEISGTLRADTETVIAAADELTSRGNSFHDVLSIILALGNFLNGSRRQALGFRIDSLSKLADLKTTAGNNPDSVENLLEYMVQYISKMENANKLLRFGMHLSSVIAASRVDPARLNRDMQTLTQGLKKIEKLKIRRFNSEDKFQEVIRKFIIEAGDAMETIEQRLEAMAHGIRSVAELYGEEEDKLVDKYDTFFTEIANFVNAFQKAKDNLESKMKRRKRKQSVGKALKLNFDPVVPTIAVETLE